MREVLLRKIRLSHYFFLALVMYGLAVLALPEYKLESGALTLFSVNSFLYGFYIAPILSAQKARIEELHRIVRAEANAIFAMVLHTKPLGQETRNKLQDMFRTYIEASLAERASAEGEEEYEKIISFCLNYKGKDKDQILKLLDSLVANQLNRTNLSMQINNRVFSNEWMIMMLLFSITVSFIMLMDVGDGYAYAFLAAFLCTGLTMLIIILAKMSTLTHKKARQIWDPFTKLLDSNFYRLD